MLEAQIAVLHTWTGLKKIKILEPPITKQSSRMVIKSGRFVSEGCISQQLAPVTARGHLDVVQFTAHRYLGGHFN